MSKLEPGEWWRSGIFKTLFAYPKEDDAREEQYKCKHARRGSFPPSIVRSIKGERALLSHNFSPPKKCFLGPNRHFPNLHFKFFWEKRGILPPFSYQASLLTTFFRPFLRPPFARFFDVSAGFRDGSRTSRPP